MSVKDLYGAAAAGLCADHPEIETTCMLKLPRQRVDQLALENVATRFDPGHGRVMKEWLTLIPADLADCRAYMTVALTYLGAASRA
jgi:hypothetical protein